MQSTGGLLRQRPYCPTTSPDGLLSVCVSSKNISQIEQEMKFIVLDRDGTLIRHIPYLCNPSAVELLPTVIDGLAEFVSRGYKIFLHTNQSGVGRGFFSYDDAVACNKRMIEKIGYGDNIFEDICICPEMPGQPGFYRKPAPRFGLEIIQKYNITKEAVCYMGDNITDLLTAKNLGCMGIGVNTGLHDLRKTLHEHGLVEYFPVFDNFSDAARYVVTSDR